MIRKIRTLCSCRHLAPRVEDRRRRRNWQHINKGMIDDSDVFSIIVDHASPANVFASARAQASTMSVSAGEQFSRSRAFRSRPAGTRAEAGSTNENIDLVPEIHRRPGRTTDPAGTWKRIGESWRSS